VSPDDLDPKQFRLLAELRETDLEVLFELLEPRRLARGRKLFREGSEADGLVLLASGRIEICGERAPTPFVLEPGAVLGELSLVTVGPRELTASTVEPCEIWRLPRDHWRRLVDDHPRTACRLLEAILAETAATIREALDRMADGADAR
jgi:CRP-like cAMP-binding protein